MDNPNYMEVLLDGKANLEELFAGLGRTPLENMAEIQAEADRILPGYQQLMKTKSSAEHILHTISKSDEKDISNRILGS
jgi:hypothetical protein